MDHKPPILAGQSLLFISIHQTSSLVLERSLLNTKASNSELSAALRTVSHADLMIYFCGFSWVTEMISSLPKS